MDINNISNRTIFRTLAIISAFIGLAIFIYLVRKPLTWLGIAFFLALAINPAVEKLARYLPKRSRGLAAGIVFLSSLALVAFMAFSLIPPLVSQTQSLIHNFPALAERVQHSDAPLAQLIRRYDLVPQIRANQDKLTAAVSSLGGSALEALGRLFSSFIAILTTLVLTFFMLLEGPKWVKAINDLQPVSKRHHRAELAQAMYRAVAGYVTGNLLTSLVASIATAIMLTIVKVPFAIPLGVAVGLFDLLPLIGATLGAVVIIVVCLFTSLTAALVMAIFFLIYQQVENHVLQPLVYSRTVQMSPLMVLASALIGTALGGLTGALVAIPIGASIMILGKDYFKNHTHAKS